MQSARARVNQQLAWCSGLLHQYGASTLPWQQQALAQGLTWHLQAAYLAFLQELAAELKFNADQPASASDLLRAVPTGRAQPLELQELVRLEQGDGWLAQLRAQPQPGEAGRTTTMAAGQLIAVSGSAVFSLQQAREALAALAELVERNRSLTAES